MRVSGRRFSFIVLVIAFTLGSITSFQLLPTMDEIEYSQEGYFTISKQDRSRSIWNGEPVVFYKGRPNHRVRSENPNNVTSQELEAWKQVLGDYRGYLTDMGIQWSMLSISPLNGTVVYYMCDLTEEKVKLFVDTMKYYVPMGVIVLSNACIVGVDSKPLKSETQFNVTIGLNEYVFDSQDTAQLIITNKDSQQITFGSPYFITEFVDGEWVKPSQFPLISGWDLLLHMRARNEIAKKWIPDDGYRDALNDIEKIEKTWGPIGIWSAKCARATCPNKTLFERYCVVSNSARAQESIAPDVLMLVLFRRII